MAHNVPLAPLLHGVEKQKGAEAHSHTSLAASPFAPLSMRCIPKSCIGGVPLPARGPCSGLCRLLCCPFAGGWSRPVHDYVNYDYFDYDYKDLGIVIVELLGVCNSQIVMKRPAAGPRRPGMQ